MVMNRVMRATAKVIFGAALVAVGGCGSSNGGDPSSGQVSIEFYNELTDTTAFLSSAVQVDLFSGSSTTAVLTKQGYSTKAAGNAATATLSDGNISLTAKQSGNKAMVAQDVANSAQAGKTYTTVLMGDLKAGQVTIDSYEQQTGSVASGKVSVRFINTLSLLSPSTVDLTTSSNSSIATGVDYGAATSYQTLSPSFGSLKINVVQSSTTVASPSCKVSAGKTYDAILAYTSFKGSTIGMYCHELGS